MPIASLVFASLAALLHVFFWVLESIRWRRPDVWKRFGAKSQEEADLLAPMALNQGYYNLFIAIGTLVGVGFSIASRGGDSQGWKSYELGGEVSAPSALSNIRDHYIGSGFITFGLLIMLGAALVLVISNRKMARAALIQGLLPALALIIAAVA